MKVFAGTLVNLPCQSAVSEAAVVFGFGDTITLPEELETEGNRGVFNFRIERPATVLGLERHLCERHCTLVVSQPTPDKFSRTFGNHVLRRMN